MSSLKLKHSGGNGVILAGPSSNPAADRTINLNDNYAGNGSVVTADSSGNVGIGTSTPSSFNSDGRNLVVGTGSGGQGLSIYSANNNYGNIYFADGTSDGSYNAGGILYNHSSNFMRFDTAAGERMRINSDGDVLIGRTATCDSSEVLGVKGPDSDNCTIGITTDGTTQAGIIGFNDDDATFRGRVQYNHNNDSMVFHTAGGEKMRIDNDGNIGFSPNGIDPSSDGGITVRQSNPTSYGPVMSFNTTQSGQGFTEFRSSGTQVGSIGKSGTTGTTYNTSSDYRLKENESSITDGITRLKVLKPYRFNWKTDASTKVDGFFAHEVTPAVPEAITGAKDAVDSNNNPIHQQIDQSKLVPLLTAALQEAIAKIETLETKVAALEAG